MRISLGSILVLIACSLSGQDTAVQAPFYARQYTYIHADSNKILHAEALDQFFIKLACLDHDSLTQLRILHIGDSHIQADFFSGPVRKALQERFGNAGRGLIFPYKVAGTNGPSDIDCYSNSSWSVKRNVFPNIDMPVGISGISMKTGNPYAVMKIGLKPVDSVAQAFDQMTVYSGRNCHSFDLAVSLASNPGVLEHSAVYSENSYYTVKSGDNLGSIAHKYGTTVTQLKNWNNLHSDFIRAGQKLVIKKDKQPVQAMDLQSFQLLDTLIFSDSLSATLGRTIRFRDPQTACYLHVVKSCSDQDEFVLQGVVLEMAESPGILYSMTGVNGAMYEHYNCSRDFIAQVREYQPDLVIISLGTNETLGSSFDELKTRSEIMKMIDSLRAVQPVPDILLTAPSDNMLRRRYANDGCIKINGLMHQIADTSHVALWDLYTVMGGHGSIEKWYRSGLARSDRIHFSVAGYELQANLLLEAIFKAYDQFKADELE
jgi:LysM repeat protein